MLSYSSLVFKKVVSYQVWLQIAKLWLAMSTEDENLLITEHTLLKLANSKQNNQLNKQTENGFLLLITSRVNAFLRREETTDPQKYQVTLAFDPSIITQELIQLSCQQKWEIAVVEYLKTNFINKLIHNHNDFAEFIVKVVKLLINEPENSEILYNLPQTPAMDILLHYQVEQERIFEQIKIQISQNLNLPEIIQTAINRSCDFLALDRLLIYQLDVPLESNIVSSKPVELVDTVTYECKKNQDITSTLYFQDEVCWRKIPQSIDKYDRGFNLVIDDLKIDSTLNPCLQELMTKLKVRAKAVTPISVENKLWGFVIAHQCSESRQWHQQDIQFLRQISEHLAIAIHHHQSYQQLQQQKLLLEKQVQNQAQQIKDALIAAEAASKSKHEFLGSMSHELRTPLTCVIGLSSTLLQLSSTKERKVLSPEKQQEYLYLIQQSGKHLLTLINNILEFSEVESGKHLLNVQQISLTGVARESIQMLQEIARAKQITLIPEIKLELDQDYFFADEIRLKEILFNLLSNGIKFTPARGEVILRLWREKRQVVLQVEDTGIGITDQEIPLLFEKFKQLEDFRQRTQGGTGLGLALTKKLVELHGGTIEVESASGEGSIFTVYLPEKIPFQPNLNAQLSVNYQTNLTSQTVMLITEDEENATFICQLLNTIECQVVWLMDSATAMNQIELLQPRIIIVDRDCSEIAVKNVAETIAQKTFTQNTNLVLLGNELNNTEWENFAKSGVDDYLLKSMTPTQVIAKISGLIKG